ncbi:MAG: hypothetical protein ACU85U_16740 [Gammaproteobacteria bacterium]|jgi:hypothetical protein
MPRAMPRRNRVDPWGDLHAVPGRGLFTGNRGCVVDDHENVVRHHGSALWIICQTKFRDWRWPLARPRRWTPLFFLDEAVALAAGHRPCALCRRDAYRAYRDAVTVAIGAPEPLHASDLNQRLHAERMQRGRGLVRRADRIVWTQHYCDLPVGAVIVGAGGVPRLVQQHRLLRFTFDGWAAPEPRPDTGSANVLTPPTSFAALRHGYEPALHRSALSGRNAWP